MSIISKIVKIEVDSDLSDDYIETELLKMGINPLRWAIVKVDNKSLTISVALETL